MEHWSLIRVNGEIDVTSLSNFGSFAVDENNVNQALLCYRSALSEDAQAPRHQTQLPVVVLQVSGVAITAQGSAGTVRFRSRPKVTPLKPPDKKRLPPQLVMARDTERLTESPMAESERYGCDVRTTERN